MLPTHLPLYRQLPVLRQAEGEFAEDSEMEGEEGGNARTRARTQSTLPARAPQLLPPGAQLHQPALEKHPAYKGGDPRLLALTEQHQPLIPAFRLLLGLPILPVPGWKRSLKNVTQVQPLQSPAQQRSPELCYTTDTSG